MCIIIATIFRALKHVCWRLFFVLVRTFQVCVAAFVSGSWDARLLQPPTITQVVCDVVAKQVVLYQYYGPSLGLQMRSDFLGYSILRFRCN